MKTVIVTIVLLMFVSVAFAGGSGGNDHKYGKQEQEQNQNQQQNQMQNTNVSIGDINATGGNADASAKADATGGTATTTIGDVSPNQTVNIENPKPITGIPLINPPSSPETQLYFLTANAVEKGVDLTLFYNETCKPINSKNLPLKSREEKIKKIQIIFTPHQDYLKEELKGSGKPEVKEVIMELPEEKVKCLGILNVESVAKKHNIPLSQINAESGNYITSNLNGFEKVYLIDMKDAIAASRGVKNAGMGLSFAPGQSWLMGQATGAIGGGLSYGSGNAQGVTQLGTTFIVLGAAPDGMIFKLPEPPEIKAPEKPIEKPAAAVEEKKVIVEVIIKQEPQIQPIPVPEKPTPEKKEKPKRKKSGGYYIPDWE